jgi:hypothetical protein
MSPLPLKHLEGHETMCFGTKFSSERNIDEEGTMSEEETRIVDL